MNHKKNNEDTNHKIISMNISCENNEFCDYEETIKWNKSFDNQNSFIDTMECNIDMSGYLAKLLKQLNVIKIPFQRVDG